MKKIIVPKLFGIIAILVLLFVSGGWIAPVKAAGSPAVGSKISSLLAIQIKEKLSEASSSGQSTVKPFADDSPSNTETTLANQEEVFLHFAQKPSSSQLNDLTALGVTVYPNTWIPPVGAFTTGFVLADMPINELSTLAAESYIVTMDTAEQSLSPQNDQAEAAMNVAPVWQSGDTGAGVTVAVLDSGIDTSNPDFPTLNSTNSMDYSNYPTLDDTITNTVTGHGTHVTGSLLGRGVNSPTYKGVAPGASLVFLKVGNDTDGSASSAAIVYALEAAVDTYHAKIINLSYGNWSEYHDGSDALCQAVDYATSQGAAVFVAAGNDGSNGWHASGTVGGAGSSYEVSIQVTGSSSLPISLVWYDDGAQNNLSLQYYGTDGTTLLASADGGQSESPRGTELNTYQLNTPVGTGTYNIKVTDNSTNYQNFQLYYLGGLTSVEFAGADPNYTICSPAEADSAIAVGCYVSRSSWTNYLGTNYSSNPAETVGSVADFSSRGPRIDMLQKPDIVAPGSAIISDRDPLYALGNPAYDPGIIDNDGLGLGPTNTGPADYYVLQGTSMASPMAAGVGALLLSQNPNMTPAQIKHTLEVTAYMPNLGSPSSPQWGWGLVNASAALSADISLNSYSTSSLNTSCTDFASYSTQHTVYLHSSNVLNSKSYNVTIYDGSNNDVANLGDFNDTYLNTNYTFTTTDKAGTWHAVVSEPQFSLPSTYNPSWVYTIMTAAFSVETSAISPGYPDVITKIVSNMTANSVTLNGQLVTPGSGGSASVSFDYGLTTNYGSAVVGVPASLDSAGTFSANISGLIPGVTYHYRARANGGAAGSVNGADMTFNTDYLIVDTVGAFAGQSSLAISNAGSISMAYSTSNSGPGYSIKYGSWNGTTWQIQTVFSSVNATSPSLALDNQGNPCIAFVDSGTLKYATLIGSTWQIQTVDSTSVNTDAISLAIDSTNKPCITYTYASNNNVEYAHWSGTGWQIQTVAPNGDMPSLCLDSNNAPHIAYENLSKENLMYAQWNGSAWQVQTVDSTTWVGLGPSLKLNGSGYPCISYYDSSNYYLKYAAWNGSAWQIQIVDDDVMGLSQIGTRCSLQLNSAENPCISYYDSASETLKYTEWNGSTWRIITVDARSVSE